MTLTITRAEIIAITTRIAIIMPVEGGTEGRREGGREGKNMYAFAWDTIMHVCNMLTMR